MTRLLLKGRFIGENIRLIDSDINYSAAKKFPGLLLFLDFEKAFDTLEWSFIQETLISFGFGPFIGQWFKTLYNNTESCIMSNGWASNFFSVHWTEVSAKVVLSPLTFLFFQPKFWPSQSNPEKCRHKRFIS